MKKLVISTHPLLLYSCSRLRSKAQRPTSITWHCRVYGKWELNPCKSDFQSQGVFIKILWITVFYKPYPAILGALYLPFTSVSLSTGLYWGIQIAYRMLRGGKRKLYAVSLLQISSLDLFPIVWETLCCHILQMICSLSLIQFIKHST